jgi:hypothetical protein
MTHQKFLSLQDAKEPNQSFVFQYVFFRLAKTCDMKMIYFNPIHHFHQFGPSCISYGQAGGTQNDTVRVLTRDLNYHTHQNMILYRERK